MSDVLVHLVSVQLQTVFGQHASESFIFPLSFISLATMSRARNNQEVASSALYRKVSCIFEDSFISPSASRTLLQPGF